jgi:ketosteroid isomerase-like protein
MSQENVEVVRRTASALAAGDWQSVFQTWDPQIEWHFERGAADFIADATGSEPRCRRL